MTGTIPAPHPPRGDFTCQVPPRPPQGCIFFFLALPRGPVPAAPSPRAAQRPGPAGGKEEQGQNPTPKTPQKKSLTHRETGPKAEPGLLLPAKARLERARRDEHQKIGSNKGRTGRPSVPLAPPVLGVLRAPTKTSQHPWAHHSTPWARHSTPWPTQTRWKDPMGANLVETSPV